MVGKQCSPRIQDEPVMFVGDLPMPPATPAALPRVFVVDDHAVVRQGLRDLLNGALDLAWCGEASDAPEAIRRVEALEPDLAVVDVALDGRSGLELVESLLARRPRLGILVLSMHEEEIYAERALRAGALGFLNKTASGAEILQALRDVASGRIHLSVRATEAALRRSVRAGGAKRAAFDALTNRELEVLESLAAGLGTRRIAEKLSLSVKTIESHREKIKRKLGLQSAPELIAHAVRWKLERQG
jgi:DNA-binding NarL/FixJ family response regulator